MNRRPNLSLLFFASQHADFGLGKYDLFRAASAFADEHGFEAVWVPERHFHPFGGIFPNPSLAAAVLAQHTRRVRIRAGSVVLPLHSPVRIAEEWAVVDNLSDGRVDLAFAIGWNPNDFVLAPDRFRDRKRLTFEGIETVRRLWRGEEIELPNGEGKLFRFRVHPLPRQPELDVWLTCSGGAERFAEAGALGVNVLTALLFQDLEELTGKIAAYREARSTHGHPGPGHVTLMLHTFVGESDTEVRHAVREPFKRYLASSIDLWKTGERALDELSPRKREDLLEIGFERYYRTNGLMGTVEKCARMVEEIHDAGVDEIACLIDFGVEAGQIMTGLGHLQRLRRLQGSPTS